MHAGAQPAHTPLRKKKDWRDWTDNRLMLIRDINTVLSTHLSIAMNVLTCLCCTVPDHVKPTSVTFHFLQSWMLSLMNHEENEQKFKGSLIFPSISPLLEKEGIYLV